MKKSILATLPIAAAVALGAGVVVPNTSAEASDPICSDNVKDYVSFETAINRKCPTITLNGPVTINTTPTINYAATIELNGNTLSGGSKTALNINGAGANVIIQGNGKVTSSNDSDGTIALEGGASLSVNSGATIENTYVGEDYGSDGIAITNSSSTLIVNDGATITSKEFGIALAENAKITVNGGTIASTKVAISSDGEGATIEVKGGSIQSTSEVIYIETGDGVENKIDISGGNLETGSNGISFFAPGTLTMTGGVIKSGLTGIELTEGAVADIKGGEIIANGTGDILAGVAVAVRSDSRATISAPTIINASNEYPVLATNAEYQPDVNNAAGLIVVNAGVQFTGTRPSAAYLAPGLAVGPNGVVMTVAEAEAMAGATENPANPNTADYIAVYAAIAAVALIGLGATAVVAKKVNR